MKVSSHGGREMREKMRKENKKLVQDRLDDEPSDTMKVDQFPLEDYLYYVGIIYTKLLQDCRD